MKAKEPTTHFKHGWQPDLPDHRDHMYHMSVHFRHDTAQPLPQLVDLRTGPNSPAIEDQGQLGSCTAFGSLGAYMYTHHMQDAGSRFSKLSHLFQYYNARSLEGTVNSDSGASIRDAIKCLGQFGVIPETKMPYDISKFKTKPTAAEYALGKKNVALEYLRVINDERSGGLTHILTSLAAGYPIVFGATLYESFESDTVATTGIVPMPGKNEQVLGGHCQAIWGYNMGNQLALVRNSWGKGWALGGYEWMPFKYLTDLNLCDDFWTLRKLS